MQVTISSGEIRRNMTILLDGDIYTVLDWQHRQAPKAPPTLTLKVRHLKTGNVYERKMQGNQKLTQAPLDRVNAQYLYSEGDIHYFMDTETYDQFPISGDILGDALKFLKEGDSLEVFFYEGQAVQTELPVTVDLQVTQTEAAVKGDTATGATKNAALETGHTVTVPLFINEGDVLKVDTRTGEYLERVSTAR